MEDTNKEVGKRPKLIQFVHAILHSVSLENPSSVHWALLLGLTSIELSKWT